MSSSQTSQKQYHHFIPQFILRNFSHKYHAPPGNRSTASRRKKKSKEPKIYAGTPVLNIVDLSGETPKLVESEVRRTFGLMDMYRDVSNTADSQYLEKEIGKLENRVSRIIADIKKAFEQGKTGVSMSRDQKDTLRRFLFIMKFRGPTFYQRFHGDSSGEYISDDADLFKAYMKEKKFRSPVDVWFKSIKTILDIKLDMQGEWKKKLVDSIYPHDAFWFIMHMEYYFLAICTPEDQGDEFILTENCYNVHEGPNSTVLNPQTGEHEVVSWTSYHEFSPLTPRLMLVLRSLMLPVAEEDTSEKIREWRRTMFESSRSQHVDPENAGSSLEDLPLTKPRNSYSQILPEGIQLLPGEDGSPRSHHQFTFPFTKINPDQTHRINTILLENAYLTSAIAFNSRPSFHRSVEYYLQLPPNRGFKVIRNNTPTTDPRLIYLKKLQAIAQALGGPAVELTYQTAPNIADLEREREVSLRQLRKKMLESFPAEPTEFMRLYNILDGTPTTLLSDLSQVRKMRYLRIKIDVATKHLHESIREKVRNNLRDIFCGLAPRRLWLYLKMLRLMSLGTPETVEEMLNTGMMEGAEDVVVKVRHVVRPECFGLLLHFTVMQDIQHRKHPGVNPSTRFELDAEGAETAGVMTRLAFSPVGSIRDCGIRRIQEVAVPMFHMLRLGKGYEEFTNPIWTVDENVEILTRVGVRDQMPSIFAGELSGDTVEELSDVLFNVVYPTYARNPKE